MLTQSEQTTSKTLSSSMISWTLPHKKKKAKLNIAPKEWWLEDYFFIGMVHFQGPTAKHQVGTCHFRQSTHPTCHRRRRWTLRIHLRCFSSTWNLGYFGELCFPLSQIHTAKRYRWVSFLHWKDTWNVWWWLVSERNFTYVHARSFRILDDHLIWYGNCTTLLVPSGKLT